MPYSITHVTVVNHYMLCLIQSRMSLSSIITCLVLFNHACHFCQSLHALSLFVVLQPPFADAAGEANTGWSEYVSPVNHYLPLLSWHYISSYYNQLLQTQLAKQTQVINAIMYVAPVNYYVSCLCYQTFTLYLSITLYPFIRTRWSLLRSGATPIVTCFAVERRQSLLAAQWSDAIRYLPCICYQSNHSFTLYSIHFISHAVLCRSVERREPRGVC
jgi:hypothetical protein